MIPLEAPPGAWVLPPWEVLGGILAGVAALVTALVGGAKVVAELRELRHQAASTAADAAAVLAQQHPNHGGSMRDALNRVEALTQQNATELAALRDDMSDVRTAQHRQDAELARIHRTVAAVGDRVTQEAARTAAQLSDHSERVRALEQTEKEKPQCFGPSSFGSVQPSAPSRRSPSPSSPSSASPAPGC